METTTEAIAALPDDALAGVLRVLPPRSLAVGRCVCKAWRDIIDARALLHRHLLPHSVRGVFVNYIDHDRPHLFSRPSSSSTFPGIDGLLSFLPNDPKHDWWRVLDHCSGLVLCSIEWESELCVCNPATERWTLLPQHREDRRQITCAYIAFDPMVSSHYEVFLIPQVPEKPKPATSRYRKAEQDLDAPFCLDWIFSLPEAEGALSIEDQSFEEDQQQPVPSIMGNKDNGPDHDDPCRLMEWPPSPWSLKVFSSRSGQWEERTFLREGQPAGTVEDMRLHRREPTWQGPRQRYAVYQNGGLYVHCRGSFVARFSLSNDTYQVIKAPEKVQYSKPYLGTSKNGVVFGEAYEGQLRIWNLNESGGHMEWFLKYQCDLSPHAYHVINSKRPMDGAWIVEEKSPDHMSDDDDEVIETLHESLEWNSDSDGTFELEEAGDQEYVPHFNILGFHPYKEVVFLVVGFKVMAYHLSSSKVQYLGYARPDGYYHNHTNGIYESFVYTPCLIGELVKDNNGRSSSISVDDGEELN